jgi:hypothetical protein
MNGTWPLRRSVAEPSAHSAELLQGLLRALCSGLASAGEQRESPYPRGRCEAGESADLLRGARAKFGLVRM